MIVYAEENCASVNVSFDFGAKRIVFIVLPNGQEASCFLICDSVWRNENSSTILRILDSPISGKSTFLPF